MAIDGLIKTRFNVSRDLGTGAPDQLRTTMSQAVSELESRIRDKVRQQELNKFMLERLRSQAASQPAGGSAPTTAQISLENDKLGREIELLQQELERQRGRLARAGDIAMEIADYDEQIRQKREFYEAVRTRLEQLDMEDKAPARVRIVAYATQPPALDRRPLLTLGVLAAAVLLSLLLLAVRPAYVSDSRVSSAQR
jgi:hypothetical protein